MGYLGRIDALSARLGVFSEDQNAEAAVALLLREALHGLEALFVKRVERPKDPWSGQMALPGGKREPKDLNLNQTVTRETREETGINLLYGCRFLGVMETVKSAVKPEIRVLPFVVLLQHQQEIRLERAELERFSWIPLNSLARHKETVKFSFGEFPAYVVGNNVIWGMTYRIVENLFYFLK